MGTYGFSDHIGTTLIKIGLVLVDYNIIIFVGSCVGMVDNIIFWILLDHFRILDDPGMVQNIGSF